MKILFSIRTLLILLLCPIISFGFNLAVSHTNETCPGNGALQFIVSNTDPNGSIVYFIYKLPDLTTPYASGPDASLNGLTPGDYRVIARETVGSVTTSQQMDVTISSSFVPLSYSVASVNDGCANTSSIIVTANTGTAATYAIISGPATFPTQTSNTFHGLVAGVYRIKVTDSCGNALVQAFNVTPNPPVLTTGNPSFEQTVPPTCTTLIANNTITPGAGTVINYPLQIHYVLHLPAGDSHINVTLNSGDPNSQDISQTIPYPGQNYIYDVILTDACGITYPLNNFIVTNDLLLSYSLQTLPCNKFYFILNTSNFAGSYTMNFTDFPAGFDPATFTSGYPGPYTVSSVTFGGANQNVPAGDYEVTVTDPCGKTDTIQFNIDDTPPQPNAIEVVTSCLSTEGTLMVSIPNYKIVTAIILTAPANFPFPLPHDISAFIDSAGAVSFGPIPLGDYTLHIVDDCGNIYDPVHAGPPDNLDQGIKVDVLQGCDMNRASIKLISNNSKLTSVKITAAPAAYGFALPHDISNHIVSTGELYLAGLPTGNYTLSTIDECHFTANETVPVDGYAITRSNFSIQPDCGVFNVPLDFIDNVTGGETFWLQKLLDPATNTWGNPASEAVYVDGTVPDGVNSVPLQNNVTNFNFIYEGVFRIVHHFMTYNSGSDINSGLVTSVMKDCVEILAPNLSFTNALAITDVLRIPCSATGNFDVLLETNGPSPLHYRIIEKDGLPMIVDNGTSNVFTNLTPGIYKFEVEDNCGNSVTRTFDVSDLNSLITIYPFCNIVSCTAAINGNETFDLTAQSAIILGDQPTADYTLTFHTSQAAADNNSNPIANLTAYDPPNNPQTLYFRIIFNQLPNCYQTGSFDLITGQIPRINLLSEYNICDNQPVTLDASAGNLATTTYLWSDGTTNPAITISQIGITNVNVTATNEYGSCNNTTFSCTNTKDITVNIADVPEIDHIETHDWTDNENSITVVANHTGDFLYSLDGITFQNSPTFDHLTPGVYTVYVRDVGGCRTVSQEVWLLNYPKFFTPNGDGYNETWQIKNSEYEPDFTVFIFDRYGKMIVNLLSNGPGWDGKYNGKLLFSDDYWFEVHRQDGRVHLGHFTLKR